MADDFEGSTLVEGMEDSENSETTENINSQDGEQPEATSEETTATDGQTSADTTQESDEPKLTEKGTKLDPNPQSAVHQELANARKEAQDYRNFLNDPIALKKYVSELEKEAGATSTQDRQELREQAEDEQYVTDPDKIQTADDLRSYAKFLKKDIEKTKTELMREAETNRKTAKEEKIASSIVSDISQVQTKYSVLRPYNADGTKNPDFDAELEKEIAETFNEVDKDPITGKYAGKTSILKIADRFMKIHQRGTLTGSKQAQTTVADKRQGAVKSGSGKATGLDETNMSASQLIASRMRRARGN